MIQAIIPIKSDSERLPNKNFLDFCGKPLYQHVLNTLQDIPLIETILINTDSEIIMETCPKLFSKVKIIERPTQLRGNHITMNTIIEFDLSKVEGEHFLQTHVTNPLLRKSTIVNAIHQYFEKLATHDSLFSVESIKKRAYDQNGTPINHCNLKLEQTQNLPPINIENSNLFLFSRSSFALAGKSRIGLTPQLFPMSSLEGCDIDYKEDFLLAELIAKNKAIFNGLEEDNLFVECK